VAEIPPSAWYIDEGIRNAEAFFRVLPKIFPEATLFIAEGSSIAKDVAAFYKRHAPAVPNRPAGLTRLALAPRYLCASTPDFFLELARIASTKPRETLLHHLSLYRDGRQLLEWHDAFANAVVLSSDLPEATVAALAKKFGCRYGRSAVA
jgi:hypothetical protein